MKELALSMSSAHTNNELSLALVTFAGVIFVGIIGLFVVVIHRQKKKKHLKALLRAKNLGPVLESREIAQHTGMKHYPQYVHIKKYKSSSRGPTPNPDIEALPQPEEKNPKNKLRRLDVNDLLAAIMVRIRRNETSFQPHRVTPTQETSFYYKESSLSSGRDHEEIKDVAVQVHHHHQSTSSDGSSSSSSSSEASNSYVSRISQQVFVPDGNKKNMRNKVASFFSSVSKYKGNTKL